MRKKVKNRLGLNISVVCSTLLLALSGCGGVSQETIDAADQKLNELIEMRTSVENGYGELTDDSLFSRVTDAGQLLDALAESSASRYNDMTEEEIQTLWMVKADELTETYSSLQELIDQSAEALEQNRKAVENKIDLTFFVLNRTGEPLRDLCWDITDGEYKKILLETKGGVEADAALAGVTVPANREYNSWELRLSATDSAGETRIWHISTLSDINPDASFYLTLEPEGKVTLSVTPPSGM